MIVKLHTQHLQTLEEIRAFLAGTTPLDFAVPARQDAYAWIEVSLRQLGFLRLGKADKGLIRDYLPKVSGFSRAQSPRIFLLCDPNSGSIASFHRRVSAHARTAAKAHYRALRRSTGAHRGYLFGPCLGLSCHRGGQGGRSCPPSNEVRRERRRA